MNKIKDWFLIRFLPVWAKETVYQENEKLKSRNAELEREITRLNAYIAGLEYGVKRRIAVYPEVKQ